MIATATSSTGCYRLPSEAEWEYAARAGTTTRYAFGDVITPKDANYGSNVGKTTEVGAYPPNGWGLYDMHGNVWEWVEDVWHNSYKGAPTDGSAWTDDKGENSSRVCVNRGGSWNDSQEYLRSANRVGNEPIHRRTYLGFRVARTLSDGGIKGQSSKVDNPYNLVWSKFTCGLFGPVTILQRT